MSKLDTRVILAMEALFRSNELDSPNQQTQGQPEPISRPIPTLDGRGMPMTPMLRARFSHCGEWTNAYLGYSFLSLTQIAARSKSKTTQKRVRERARYWAPGALAANFAKPCAVTLFGDDPIEMQEIYLIADPGREEPQVVRYFGQDERVFSSLLDFLCFAAGNPR